MKKILLGALALGSLAVTVPAFAQGISVDVPGFHAGVGDRYYGDRDDWRWRHRHEFGAYNEYRGGCRDITVTRQAPNGVMVTRNIRRCD